MSENKKKLHEMIDGITKEGTLEYLTRFVELFLEKWG